MDTKKTWSIKNPFAGKEVREKKNNLPYQTLISSLVHRFAVGDFKLDL
jgi:hypothetical protein